ncbi:hypothetical protein QUF75_05780 [Desulfococcaceae bacterium HSG7]|nr:hypothetical protein [Desulfococcaceae bacterium HSG7]
MKPATGWVKQPKSAIGLDHLGSQAPCINLYGRLLPGITNVTDRARYYSFYPWFFWAFEQNYQSIKWEEIVSRYRKADCLFTLIAARHANQTDQNDENHGIAMIGRNTLVNALNKLETEEKPLLLSTYATRESDTPDRYFKNKLGGLGQYYIGTFKDLGLLDGNSRSGIKYTKQRAVEIAETFDSGVDRKLFFDAIDNDKVSTETLDALASFCPCHLSEATSEKAILIDLFFDRKNIYGDEGNRRRLTLCMLLSLIEQLEQINPQSPDILDHFLFRNAVYSGYLNTETRWALPEILESIRKDWAIYQRNELLSISLQSIFWIALRILSESETIYPSSEAFINHLCRSAILEKALVGQKDINVLDGIKDLEKRLPAISSCNDLNHECFVARDVSKKCSDKNPDPEYGSLLQRALNTLLTLASRSDPGSEPYGPFKFPDNYFNYYPINLHSFQSNLSNIWHNLSLKEFVLWLVHRWCLENHLRVALRKMCRDKLDTFRFRPTDDGLKVVDSIPEPVFTTPRFKQGLKMLWDLGAIEPGPGKGTYKITALGKELSDATIGNQ